jgi:hypothetical protein
MECCRGVAYVYYDPDVLPEGVKKLLPIQEPKGKGMTLEEYEQWRSKQGSYPTDSKRNTHHEEKSLKGYAIFVLLGVRSNDANIAN